MVSEQAKFQAGVVPGLVADYCLWYPAANGHKRTFASGHIRPIAVTYRHYRMQSAIDIKTNYGYMLSSYFF